jgi:hypothetical protein
MTIVSRSGPFQISQRRLQNLWPGGMNQARAIGNRVLYAEDVLARPFESASERESCNVALDWLKSRAVAWPQASGNGYSQTSIYDDRADNLRSAFRSGDPYTLFAALKDCLEFFESLNMLYGPRKALGRDILNEVLDMGLEAAPLVAYVPEILFELTQYMWKMTNCNDRIIESMILAIPPQDQNGLFQFGKNEILNGNNGFPVKVLASMLGIDESLIEVFVLTGKI